jgi:hypothetical protein
MILLLIQLYYGRDYCIKREKCRGREPSGIVRSLVVCGDQVLQLGVQERGEKEREERIFSS